MWSGVESGSTALFPYCLYNLIQSPNMCSCTHTYSRTRIAHSTIIDACTSKKKKDICQDLRREEGNGIGKAELGHRKPKTGLSIVQT